jgi:hypothetical protein
MIQLSHTDRVLRVSVHAETDQLPVVVVNGVEMLKEEPTEEEVAIVVSVQRILRNSELANTITLVKVSKWFHIKHGVTDLEGHWLDLLCKVFAFKFR